MDISQRKRKPTASNSNGHSRKTVEGIGGEERWAWHRREGEMLGMESGNGGWATCWKTRGQNTLVVVVVAVG